MARPKKKAVDRFAPAAGTRRIVPMRDGAFTVHTPDGKALRRTRAELAYLVVEFDDDDRTPGWYSAALVDLDLVDVLDEVAVIRDEVAAATAEEGADK